MTSPIIMIIITRVASPGRSFMLEYRCMDDTGRDRLIAFSCTDYRCVSHTVEYIAQNRSRGVEVRSVFFPSHRNYNYYIIARVLTCLDFCSITLRTTFSPVDAYSVFLVRGINYNNIRIYLNYCSSLNRSKTERRICKYNIQNADWNSLLPVVFIAQTTRLANIIEHITCIRVDKCHFKILLRFHNLIFRCAGDITHVYNIIT